MNIIKYKKISNVLGVLSFLVGFIISISIMNGDSLGRVNILYLLLLYVFLPISSFLLFLFLKARTSDINFISLIFDLAVLPKHWRSYLFRLQGESFYPMWLLHQSQKNYLIFSISSLLGFLSILLINDVTFIWRSTLLTSEQLFPLVKALATPWFFIDSAQPLLTMLTAAQDSRLQLNLNLSNSNTWWQYVLMSQMIYAIFPRVILYCWSLKLFNAEIAKSITEEQSIKKFKKAQAYQQPDISLDAVIMNEQLFENYLLLYWIELPEILKDDLKKVIGTPAREYMLNTNALFEFEGNIINDKREKVLIVPSWEPPLGELADFMNQSAGYLVPVDWKDEQLQPIAKMHLDEWNRFCSLTPSWKLLSNKAFL